MNTPSSMFATSAGLLRRCMLLLAGLLCLASVASAYDWHDATVEFSDGKVITARIAFAQDMFYMYNEAAKRRLTVRIGEIKSIETTIEKESMEKKCEMHPGRRACPASSGAGMDTSVK